MSRYLICELSCERVQALHIRHSQYQMKHTLSLVSPSPGQIHSSPQAGTRTISQCLYQAGAGSEDIFKACISLSCRIRIRGNTYSLSSWWSYDLGQRPSGRNLHGTVRTGRPQIRSGESQILRWQNPLKCSLDLQRPFLRVITMLLHPWIYPPITQSFSTSLWRFHVPRTSPCFGGLPINLWCLAETVVDLVTREAMNASSTPSLQGEST